MWRCASAISLAPALSGCGLPDVLFCSRWTPWPSLRSRQGSAPCSQEAALNAFPFGGTFCPNPLAGHAERHGVCGCASSFLVGELRLGGPGGDPEGAGGSNSSPLNEGRGDPWPLQLGWHSCSPMPEGLLSRACPLLCNVRVHNTFTQLFFEVFVDLYLMGWFLIKRGLLRSGVRVGRGGRCCYSGGCTAAGPSAPGARPWQCPAWGQGRSPGAASPQPGARSPRPAPAPGSRSGPAPRPPLGGVSAVSRQAPPPPPVVPGSGRPPRVPLRLHWLGGPGLRQSSGGAPGSAPPRGGLSRWRCRCA